MGSRTLTLATDASTGAVSIASQAEATIGDIFSTAISTDKVVTGTYGLLQRLAIFEAGAIVSGMSAGRGLVEAATFGKAG